MKPKIMIVTGEASGDLHGAHLIKSLRSKIPQMQVFGMGCAELAAQDVEIVFDASKVSVVGISEVFAHLPDIIAAQRVLRRKLKEDRPDLLILIDLPDFNLMLAKQAKKLGVPVFYYISPQVWAWRSGRIKTLRDRVDKLGVILPFEESFFRQHGVNAEYVGHPLLDTVKTTQTKAQFFSQHTIPNNTRCIGILPGSRKREVALLLPDFLAAARILQNEITDKITFLIPQASTISSEDFDAAGLSQYQRHLDIRVIAEERYDLMAACEAVIAASGTVTLELAILNIPMVVAYKLSPLTYFLGRLLVKLDYFSLVNLIAGFAAVPELLQNEATPQKIAGELMAILMLPEKRQKMLEDLCEVRRKLGSAGASEKAADVAISLLSRR